MTLQDTLGQVPDAGFGILNTIVSYINMILTNVFGPASPFVVAILAFVGGWFLKRAIAKNQTSYVLYVLVSLLIFLSARYLGLGG